ncbi:MAG: LLM class flavin-dependent oxidoreductase [Thermoleophilaceae bacterium]|nr:LLM class flavin-dependent oxidoreductase [Thermoleophilaceae bacterium]
MSGLRLNVLDQSPISEGSTGPDALRNTLDLAQLTDSLGYDRYWVAEHHGTPTLACASPEVLIGPIAAATARIRVGSGGVMLPHYSPLSVAERFSILSGLSPGRIDLGIGRAPGTDQLTMLALQRDRRQAAPNDFPEQLTELLAYLEDRMPADHPFARLSATLPGIPERPEVWLLGSSPQSAIWAGELGVPYSFADFINPSGAEIAGEYRRRFQDTGRSDGPLVSVGVVAVCADTDEEAERLAASGRMSFSLLRQGSLIPVPPVEKALRYLETRERAPSRRRAVIGSPDTVREGLEAVAAEYGAREVTILTITHEHEARRRSYELIAEAFGLSAGREPAGVSAQP